MAGSVHHPDHFRQAARASLKVQPVEKAICDALGDGEQRLDRMQRQIVIRVDNDAPALDHKMLDEVRRIAGDLLRAADEYQRGAT